MSKPCHTLHLEIAAPDPRGHYFVLDVDKLDSPSLLAPAFIPPSGTGSAIKAFTLDSSLLDGPDLIEYKGDPGLDPGHVWLDFTSKSMDIAIDRGVDYRQSISARPVAGVLTASIVDPYLDALANHAVGIRSQIRLRVGNDIVFAGRVTAFATSWNYAGLPVVEVEAADLIAALNSTLMPARPAETYGERVNAVCQAVDVVDVISGPGVAQTATDTDRTALDTLRVAQDSEASLVFVDRLNQLHALTRGQEVLTGAETPKWLFADDHTMTGHICMTDLGTGMDTRQIINELSARNLEFDTSDPDPTRHRWTTVEHTYTDGTSTRWYGVSSTTVTTALDPANVPALATHAFTLYSHPQRKITHVAYITDDWSSLAVPPVTLLDVGDIARIYVQSLPTPGAIDQLRRVASISHRLTPTVWETQIAFL